MERAYLVLANRTLVSTELDLHLLRLHEAGPARFHVLVPLEIHGSHALAHSENLRWSGETASVTAARLRLRRALEHLAELGLAASGDVSEMGPVRAAVTALAHDTYDGLVVSTLERGASRWVRMDVPARLRRRSGLPVVHVETSNDRIVG